MAWSFPESEVLDVLPSASTPKPLLVVLRTPTSLSAVLALRCCDVGNQSDVAENGVDSDTAAWVFDARGSGLPGRRCPGGTTQCRYLPQGAKIMGSPDLGGTG